MTYYDATHWQPVPDRARTVIVFLRGCAAMAMIAFFLLGAATIWFSFSAVLPYWAAAAIIWGISGSAARRVRPAKKAPRIQTM